MQLWHDPEMLEQLQRERQETLDRSDLSDDDKRTLLHFWHVIDATYDRRLHPGTGTLQ